MVASGIQHGKKCSQSYRCWKKDHHLWYPRLSYLEQAVPNWFKYELQSFSYLYFFNAPLKPVLLASFLLFLSLFSRETFSTLFTLSILEISSNWDQFPRVIKEDKDDLCWNPRLVCVFGACAEGTLRLGVWYVLYINGLFVTVVFNRWMFLFDVMHVSAVKVKSFAWTRECMPRTFTSSLSHNSALVVYKMDSKPR